MKKFYLLFTLSIFLIFSCSEKEPIPDGLDFKQEMRNFVQDISQYSKNLKSNFIIISQNGEELLSIDGSNIDVVDETYANAIDGIGCENLLFGYISENKQTPTGEKNYMLDYLFLAKDNGIKVLVTDCCSDSTKMNYSFTENNLNGFISFNRSKSLDTIPAYLLTEYATNTTDIWHLGSCKNFVSINNYKPYTSKKDFINSINKTNYDLIIMSLFFNNEKFTKNEINSIKTKNNGSKRLVVCYLNIGELNKSAYYWQDNWETEHPSWIENFNENNKGNYTVRYWEQDWKKIIFGKQNSYINKIIATNFDGAYINVANAYGYYE